MENHYILFCSSPFAYGKPDPDYEDEFAAAHSAGFNTLLFSFEDLTAPEQRQQALKNIQPAELPATAIYRGWMLTPAQYAFLYEELLLHNYRLINSPEGYRNCHYLPDSLRFIAEHTPATVFEKLENEQSIASLIAQARIFENRPVILKDYVKSEKHDWETACFVPDASNREQLEKSIRNLIHLRGEYLNEGIVIRAFVELNDLTIHSKSAMPLTEEYRLFFCNQKLIGVYDYWEEGNYDSPQPETAPFEELAQTIESNFFSMDIARRKTGELIVIELGDGQVAGLPDKLDRVKFYRSLMRFANKASGN